MRESKERTVTERIYWHHTVGAGTEVREGPQGPQGPQGLGGVMVHVGMGTR